MLSLIGYHCSPEWKCLIWYIIHFSSLPTTWGSSLQHPRITNALLCRQLRWWPQLIIVHCVNKWVERRSPGYCLKMNIEVHLTHPLRYSFRCKPLHYQSHIGGSPYSIFIVLFKPRRLSTISVWPALSLWVLLNLDWLSSSSFRCQFLLFQCSLMVCIRIATTLPHPAFYSTHSLSVLPSLGCELHNSNQHSNVTFRIPYPLLSAHPFLYSTLQSQLVHLWLQGSSAIPFCSPCPPLSTHLIPDSSRIVFIPWFPNTFGANTTFRLVLIFSL